MGTFDEWQAQKDSQYILAVDYLEQLATQHDSTIEATANYLIHCDSLKEIYEKSDNGEYYPIYEPTGYGYYNNDTPPQRIQFLESAKANTDTTGKILSRDFYKQWDNHYFKKSELPAIEPVTPNEPKAGEIKPHDDTIELGENQKLMRYFETFTPHDLACFIVDYNPAYNQNDDDFNKAYLLVSKAVNAGVLKPNAQNEIPKEQVKQYLKSIDWIYKGFNDNLPPVTADKIGHATITQTMPTDSQLSQQVADLKAQLASATDTISSLQEKLQQSNFDRLESYNFNTAELNQYQKENEKLKAKIAELEANEPSQSDTVAEKILHPRTANNASKIISALASELLGMDLTQPFADDTNGKIFKAIQRQGNSLSKDTIADWLRQAHEISK